MLVVLVRKLSIGFLHLEIVAEFKYMESITTTNLWVDMTKTWIFRRTFQLSSRVYILTTRQEAHTYLKLAISGRFI